MVFAFVIQTMDGEEPEIAYYRFYSTWMNEKGITPNSENSCLFSSSVEKKDLIKSMTKKNHMLYSLKLKQSLIPIQNQDSEKLRIKGFYTERNWISKQFCVVWEGAPGIGFSLVCKSDENLVNAQHILDIIVTKLDKYLKLPSYPTMTTKSLDTIALIVDRFLPAGQLLYLNSSLVKYMEKQLEIDLQS